MRHRMQPGPGALLEVGLLFLPAIPAYLWLWPAVGGTRGWLAAQVGAYAYLLLGTLAIGLRRWQPVQLGIHRRGIGVSLLAGGALLLGRTLVILGTNLPIGSRIPTWDSLVQDIAFYFGAVGIVEELLFRGLIYTALEEWRGARWAVWGSALGFGLYHVGWQGLAGFVGGAIVGLYFALIRRCAGGVLGLVLVHGAIDVAAVAMAPKLSMADFGDVQIVNPLVLLLGYLILVAGFVALWRAGPRAPVPERGTPSAQGEGGSLPRP